MIQKLEAQVRDLEEHIKNHALLRPELSTGSVGWHIEHCLLTMDAVGAALAQSRPEAYVPRFDIRRVYVMLTGKIPRGKSQAPKVVRPQPGLDAASLEGHIVKTEKGLKGLEVLAPDHFFTHPFLGDFRLRPALRFLQVHTKHHLAIIRDIARAGQQQ